MNHARRIHLVSIQRNAAVQNPQTGAMTDNWVDVYTNIFAAIEPLSVRGYLQSKADQSDVSVRIEIDALPGLDSTMRIVGVCGCHVGKIYNPVGILEDMLTGQEYLTIPCSQGVNQG